MIEPAGFDLHPIQTFRTDAEISVPIKCDSLISAQVINIIQR